MVGDFWEYVLNKYDAENFTIDQVKATWIDDYERLSLLQSYGTAWLKNFIKTSIEIGFITMDSSGIHLNKENMKVQDWLRKLELKKQKQLEEIGNAKPIDENIKYGTEKNDQKTND
jgi:hypothetical protein